MERRFPFHFSAFSAKRKTLSAMLPCSLKFALLLSSSLFVFTMSSTAPVHALNIGFHALDASVSNGKNCSRKCESDFCSVPPLLRYGKYCGVRYSGCPGEKPCDGLDACCMKHDDCVQSKHSAYLSRECSQNFLSCLSKFKRGKDPRTFEGNKCRVNEVVDELSTIMEAALLAGKVLRRP